MNLVDCTLVEERKGFYLAAKEFRIPLPAKMSSELRSYIDAEVKMGIRPEDIYESKSSEGLTHENAIRMTLDLIESVRPYLLLHLRAGRIPLVATVKHTETGVSQETIMEMDHSKIHLFDERTTQAIM